MADSHILRIQQQLLLFLGAESCTGAGGPLFVRECLGMRGAGLVIVTAEEDINGEQVVKRCR